jgi:hypothetical protein
MINRIDLKYIVPIICVMMSSCMQKSMSKVELQKYVRDTENGLIKNVSTSAANFTMCYWPKELILAAEDESERENMRRQLDSIDYFMVTYSPNIPDNFSEPLNSKIVLHGDTINSRDAIILPQANTTERNYSIMYAFKSFLNKRDEIDEVAFMIDAIGERSKVTFKGDNIRSVQKIKIQ